MPNRIGALLTAAGESVRMGFDKSMISIHCRPLIHHSASVINKAAFSQFFVTIPPKSLFNQALLEGLLASECSIMLNLYPDLGFLGSIKTVLSRAKHLDGLLICPIDSPVFSKELLFIMHNLGLLSSHPTIIVPHHFFMAGHPVYISRHFFKEAQTRRLDHLIRDHRSSLKALFWPDQRILFNLNSPSDLSLLVHKS